MKVYEPIGKILTDFHKIGGYDGYLTVMRDVNNEDQCFI